MTNNTNDENTYRTPRTAQEAPEAWKNFFGHSQHEPTEPTPAREEAPSFAGFYDNNPLNAEPRPERAAPVNHAGEDPGTPPQGETGLNVLAAILGHETPFNLADLKERVKKAGQGVDLKLHFYKAINGEYSLAPATMKFRGITVFAARTGGGKTLFATSLAAHALATRPEYHVVFLSLEESKATISQRLLTAYIDFTADERERKDALSLDTVETFIRGEPIQDEFTINDYIQTGRRPYDTRIKEAAAELARRLTVIDIESFDEARARFAQTFDDAGKAAELSSGWKADQSATVRGMIDYYRRAHGDKVLFFVDYAQRIHNNTAENRNGANYKEIQAVMADLISEARRGAVVFLAAQMNRDNSTESKNDARKEFFNALPEQLREAADIEQAAEIILYLTIDRETTPNMLNVRVLKYRNGDALQYAAAPIFWSTRAARLAELEKPSFTAPTHKRRDTAPANENDDDTDDDSTPPPSKSTTPRKRAIKPYKGGA